MHHVYPSLWLKTFRVLHVTCFIVSGRIVHSCKPKFVSGNEISTCFRLELGRQDQLFFKVGTWTVVMGPASEQSQSFTQSLLVLTTQVVVAASQISTAWVGKSIFLKVLVVLTTAYFVDSVFYNNFLLHQKLTWTAKAIWIQIISKNRLIGSWDALLAGHHIVRIERLFNFLKPL